MNKEEYEKQNNFIKELVKLGIPRKNLSGQALSGFPMVTIWREKPLYKKPKFGNVGLYKQYTTFGKANLKRAIDFYKSPQK